MKKSPIAIGKATTLIQRGNVSTLDATTTGLLIIDMQNGFCHPESHMGQNVGTETQQKIVPTIEYLVNFCRNLKIPIFWSQQIHLENDQTRLRRRLRTHSQKQNFLPCLENTFEVDFFHPIKKIMSPEDEIIKKHRASVFFDTNFSSLLRIKGIDTLLIAGCNTEFCVAHTVRDAYARDFDILLVKDCLAGIDPKFHDNMIEIIGSYLAEIVNFDRVSEYFS